LCTLKGKRERTGRPTLWYLGNVDGPQCHFRLEFSWVHVGEDERANDGAKPADLEHKFADMGMKALWGLGLNCLKVN